MTADRRAVMDVIRHRWLGACGLVVTLIVVLSAALAPWIAPRDPLAQDLLSALEAPGPQHWFGADHLGRDVLSRVLFGGRISLVVGFGSVAIGMAVGGLLGMVAGSSMGRLDAIVMRAVDVLLAFPGFILAAAVVAVLGPGLFTIVLAIGARAMPVFARLTRNMMLSIRELPYVESARALGASRARILLWHIGRNMMALVLVLAMLRVGSAILTGAALSFLGIGVGAETPDWGSMLSQGQIYMQQYPHLVIFPGLAIIVCVLGLNLLSDELRSVWDPKARGRQYGA